MIVAAATSSFCRPQRSRPNMIPVRPAALSRTSSASPSSGPSTRFVMSRGRRVVAITKERSAIASSKVA